MKLWVQLQHHDDDVQFPDGSSYDVLPGGVLRVFSGTDVHLYSPAYWQEITVEATDSLDAHRGGVPVDDELRWQ